MNLTRPIHIIDFEGSPYCSRVEYGVITLEVDGTLSNARTKICQLDAPPTIFPIQNLRDLFLAQQKHASPFSQEWDYFSMLPQTGTLAAHNATVEDHILRCIWPFCNLRGNAKVSWGPWIDSYRIYQFVFPNLKSYKLEALIHFFDLQASLKAIAKTHCPPRRQNPHCALYDAIAAALLIANLKRYLPHNLLTLEWLLCHSISLKATKENFAENKLF